MLSAMDAQSIYPNEIDLSGLNEAQRAQLANEILTRVTRPRGRQAGAGASIAYMTAAAELPGGAEIAARFLSRRWTRVPREMPAAISLALDAIGAHERDGGTSPATCALLTDLLTHPPSVLVRGGTAALRLEQVALVASACPSPPLADITRVCHGTAGTECDTARVRAGDPARTDELVEGALRMRTPGESDQIAMNRFRMTASAFRRAGSRAPIARLLPMLDSPRVLRVLVGASDGPSGGTETYANVGVADLFVGLAVAAWQLPVSFPPTPRDAVAERVYTAAERAEVRRLVMARRAH